MAEILKISVGKSRTDAYWRQEHVEWGDFMRRLTTPVITGETAAEYARMSKEEQGRAKDVGGFVGAVLRQGRRRAADVVCRTLITLDLDSAPEPEALWARLREVFPGKAMAMYSTHSHTASKPRLRWVAPLSGGGVTPQSYEAVARAVAALIGIEYMDATTYQAERLFYWYSASKDAERFAQGCEGEAFDGAEILRTAYGSAEAAADSRNWAKAKDEPDAVARRYGSDAERLDDPRKKPGIVGLFCRAYTVYDVLGEHLAAYYSETRQRGRYTYAYGHTQGGALVYDGGLHLYSMHDTDPAGGGHCRNAFDLCRIHLFGHLDKGGDYDEGVTEAHSKRCPPSFRACAEWAETLPEVQMQRRAEGEAQLRTITQLKESQAPEDGAKRGGAKAPAAPEEEGGLEMHKGEPRQTMANVMRAWSLDAGLQGQLWYNEHDGYIYTKAGLAWEKRPHVWRDADDAQLHAHMELKWGLTCTKKIDEVRVIAAERMRRHPLREWLEALPEWDGAKRCETLLVRYLGAEDTELTRAMTRKHLAAAVARVMSPGCKYDYCLTLSGPQGLGKSSLIAELCPQRRYFMDSIQNIEGKDAMEQLRTAWLVEIGELSAMKRAAVESTKSFLSRQVDMFRRSYGRNVEAVPRQCVFWATTNDEKCLKDTTGNRRFWIVKVGVQGKAAPWSELAAEREQVWAEALALWRQGEALWLEDPEMEAEANAVAEQCVDSDDDRLRGLLEAFLDFPIDEPSVWASKSVRDRQDWYGKEQNTVHRRSAMCVVEFLTEYVGMSKGDRNYWQMARTAARLMNEMEGWDYVSSSRHAQALYGRQKAWVRQQKSDRDEL